MAPQYAAEIGLAGRREMKTRTKIRLLVMSKLEKEKRLDELNQKLRITQPQDPEEIAEREWLKKKLGYKQH
jgi:hypothetical protein